MCGKEVPLLPPYYFMSLPLLGDHRAASLSSVGFQIHLLGRQWRLPVSGRYHEMNLENSRTLMGQWEQRDVQREVSENRNNPGLSLLVPVPRRG